MLDVVSDTADLYDRKPTLESEMERLVEDSEELIKQNAAAPIEEGLYTERYDELVANYNKKKEEYAEVESVILHKESQATRLRTFIGDLAKTDEPIKEFDEKMWCSMIDEVTTYTKDKIVFKFKGGSYGQEKITHTISIEETRFY